MADKFPPLTADRYRFLMECYDHEGRLVDVCTPSFSPGDDPPGPFSWTTLYLRRNAAVARVRISSLSQLCWVGGCENG